MRASRVAEGVRVAFGVVQLLAPRHVAGLVGCRPSPTAVTLTRVLGARQVTQGVVLLALDRPGAHRVGGVVDALHAASLVPIGASAHGDDRRLAASDGIVASLFALTEIRLSAGRAPGHPSPVSTSVIAHRSKRSTP
ncbi:hypothetical protein PCC79_12505 [Propioniciclava soli]|uniref:Secreted protein n=1 Tax=Propioniciclava soli TaxID=2775081 RepID=A0ABZ3C7K1_9ACTN